MRGLKSIWLTGVAATILVTGAADAQTQASTGAGPAPAGPAKGPEDSSQAADGNEVVVTARRTAERLQDVPVAVTAFAGAQHPLRRRGRALGRQL